MQRGDRLSPAAKLCTLGRYGLLACRLRGSPPSHPSARQLRTEKPGPSAGPDAKLHCGELKCQKKPEEIEEALRDIRAALRRIDRVLDGVTLVETPRSWILRELIQAYIEMDIVEENEGN